MDAAPAARSCHHGGVDEPARFASVVSPHPDGVAVAVWVVPGASRDQVTGIHDGALRVRVAAAPEAGKANRAVARLVAGAVGGRRARVSAGHGSRRKTVVVDAVTAPEAAAALARGV